jgi:hypothetical protein
MKNCIDKKINFVKNEIDEKEKNIYFNAKNMKIEFDNLLHQTNKNVIDLITIKINEQENI